MKFHHAVLENGLTIIAEEQPTALSFAAGYFVRTGARDETPSESGVSHFLEHMLFKGTERRSAEDLNREFDELGADYNAFTSEETTVYYGAVLPEFREPLVDLLSDMMRPALREADFDVEKQVILEEIALYKDRPQFTVIEEARATYYEGHPLGQSVLGTTESISALTRAQMYDYWRRRYAPANLILAVTGKFDWPAVLAQVRHATRHWPAEGAGRFYPEFTPRPRMRVRHEERVARAHLALVAPGLAATDERRFAADVVADILGGGEGSRLFWELVDPGLADAAHLSHDTEDRSGAFFAYLSCDPARAGEVLRRARQVLAAAMEGGVTEDDVERARRKAASALTVQEETPRGRLFRLGFDWLYRREYQTTADAIERFLAVTAPEANRFLATRPFSVLTTVALGPPAMLMGEA